MDAPLDPALVGRLAALLADVTGTPAGTLSAASSRDATAGWDSFANLQFISAIDEEFGVVIPTAMALRLSTLGDFARFVAAAGQPAAGPSQPGARGG